MSDAAQSELLNPNPPTTPKPPDLWSMLARKKLGLSDKWRWLDLAVLDKTASTPRAQAQSLIKGAEPTGEVFKSGPRKGQVNWQKIVPGSERTLAVTFGEYDAFCAAWELETGLCADCGGARGEPAAGNYCHRKHPKATP